MAPPPVQRAALGSMWGGQRRQPSSALHRPPSCPPKEKAAAQLASQRRFSGNEVEDEDEDSSETDSEDDEDDEEHGAPLEGWVAEGGLPSGAWDAAVAAWRLHGWASWVVASGLKKPCGARWVWGAPQRSRLSSSPCPDPQGVQLCRL